MSLAVPPQARQAGLVAAFISWRKIEPMHIQPGNPQQNACIEHYNRTIRYGWLNNYTLGTLAEVQDFATR